MIDTPSVGDQAPRKLARSTLADVIELRIEELFLLVQAELRHSGFEELLGAGIVLTGGSSRMEGMAELAEEVFHMPVRLGLPKYVGGLSEMVRSPIYSTAVGLVLFGHKLSTEPPVSRVGLAGSRQLVLRLKNWFRSRFGEDGQ